MAGWILPQFVSAPPFSLAPVNSITVSYSAPDHSPSEERFITVGMSRNGRVLIVAHSDRGENIRIISARKTTLRERKHYEEEN